MIHETIEKEQKHPVKEINNLMELLILNHAKINIYTLFYYILFTPFEKVFFCLIDEFYYAKAARNPNFTLITNLVLEFFYL